MQIQTRHDNPCRVKFIRFSVHRNYLKVGRGGGRGRGGRAWPEALAETVWQGHYGDLTTHLHVNKRMIMVGLFDLTPLAGRGRGGGGFVRAWVGLCVTKEHLESSAQERAGVTAQVMKESA